MKQAEAPASLFTNCYVEETWASPSQRLAGGCFEAAGSVFLLQCETVKTPASTRTAAAPITMGLKCLILEVAERAAGAAAAGRGCGAGALRGAGMAGAAAPGRGRVAAT